MVTYFIYSRALSARDRTTATSSGHSIKRTISASWNAASCIPVELAAGDRYTVLLVYPKRLTR
jgi:hypothetical protein